MHNLFREIIAASNIPVLSDFVQFWNDLAPEKSLIS